MLENPISLSKDLALRSLEAQEWGEFRNLLLDKYPEEDIGSIEHAYRVAEGGHRYKYRKSGERYFSHPRESAILLLESGINKPRPIILALLHDIPEDEPDLLESAPGPTHEFQSRTWARLTGSFDKTVAEGLDILTEPNSEDAYGGKDAAEQEYHDRFEDFDTTHEMAAVLGDDDLIYDVLLVKIADRIHNLRTLGAMPRKKQLAKIEETQKVYLPAFSKVTERYPSEGAILLSWINAALTSAQANLQEEFNAT